jgi:Asp-tRNA(Asn)/Glu-tRNA(Gln) amidotransferase A subunit family amidase
MSDLTFFPPSMAEQIRKKKISPVELVEAHLARSKSLNPKLNAFVQLDAERCARSPREAEAAVMQNSAPRPAARRSHQHQEFDQWPGMRCESGTRLRAGFVATQDAPLVARLKEPARSSSV